mmetsp:Transcript_16908/g.29040  ORF Transcript_16908/g.29040 Transcript_16908/m.29040 type:complete len:307 (-) Transcript_16908:4046-4966(-)
MVMAQENPAAARPLSLKKDQPALEHWDLHLPKYVPLGTSKRGNTPEEVMGQIENTFTTPPSETVDVRDNGYLNGTEKTKDARKTSSAEALYTVVGVNVFRSKKSLDHISSKVQSLKDYIKKHGAKTKSGLPQFLVVTWIFKSAWKREYTSVVHLFKLNIDFEASPNGEEMGFERAIRGFLDGDKKVKSEKLKFAFSIDEGSTKIKKAVNMLGGDRPVLIGKALTTHFFEGEHYLEINQDVGSSMVAKMLNSTILKASGGMVASTSWMIEAQEEKELPERVLAIVRWHYVKLDDVCIQLDDNFALVN